MQYLLAPSNQRPSMKDEPGQPPPQNLFQLQYLHSPILSISLHILKSFGIFITSSNLSLFHLFYSTLAFWFSPFIEILSIYMIWTVLEKNWGRLWLGSGTWFRWGLLTSSPLFFISYPLHLGAQRNIVEYHPTLLGSFLRTCFPRELRSRVSVAMSHRTHLCMESASFSARPPLNHLHLSRCYRTKRRSLCNHSFFQISFFPHFLFLLCLLIRESLYSFRPISFL